MLLYVNCCIITVFSLIETWYLMIDSLAYLFIYLFICAFYIFFSSCGLNKDQMTSFIKCLERTKQTQTRFIFPWSSLAGLYCLLNRTNLISLLHSRDYWSSFHPGKPSKQLFLHCGLFFLSVLFTWSLCCSPKLTSACLISAWQFMPWPPAG